ncbi:IS5 family transposase [Thorsellia kenyensis]|uniref:IS5 family transposase n=1 Tax=Thorsellia kenyensis TaxID=1549888 RepID=A0ABV6CAI3_9GAMM
MWKNIQPSFQFTNNSIKQHKAFEEFDTINALIDWEQIISILNVLIANKKNRLGASPYAPTMMFKVLLLQSLHNLSDVKMENMLARDLLFRQFVGLHQNDSIPDHSSIWRFREKLEKANLVTVLFDNINQQLAEQSIIVQKGSVSIIDATVIKALNNRPNKDKVGKNTQDEDASYNLKTGSDGKMKTTYGFKGHIACDEDGFVTQAVVTTGKLHDSQVFEELLTGNEVEVYADSAYASEKTAKQLESKGIENKILKRAYRNKPLTKEDKAFNRVCSGIRSRVESIFGLGKMHLGMGQARYKGLKRNALSFSMRCMVLNLKRATTIKKELEQSQAN